MQAIMETVFDIVYLCFAIGTGLIMITKGKSQLIRQAGWMTFLLGAGDSFHLVPRVYSLWSGGLEAHAAALGVGKFVTSITMTIFYVILYAIWKEYFHVGDSVELGGKRLKTQTLTWTMWGLAIIRIVLCLFPQNEWLVYKQPLSWGIIRNIPFALMGVLIIWLFAEKNKEVPNSPFHWLPLAVTLSFAFYLLVVLFANTWPLMGMLMIPKTLCYVWIICMFWKLYRQEQ